VALMSASFSTQAVLTSLIASVVLLFFRAWSQSKGSALTRTVSRVLDVAIAVLVVLFVLFIVIRFKNLA
jgi:hypothetical protein